MYVLYVFSLTWHLEYTLDEIHETLSKNKYKGEVKSICSGWIFNCKYEKIWNKGLRKRAFLYCQQCLKNLPRAKQSSYALSVNQQSNIDTEKSELNNMRVKVHCELRFKPYFEESSDI